MLKANELSAPFSCINKARDDEMLFVLLARDSCAPVAIRAWVEARILAGLNKRDDLKIIEALQCADAMEIQRQRGRLAALA